MERVPFAHALVGTDSVGDSLLTEGFAVSVPSARAERLVTAAQPRFLEEGYYLFRSEQHFGIGGQADGVALFPRSDAYEILRLMGTNGGNYDIGPDSIVAWLKALARDHPFVLTGMGFDWVEGRFRSAIGDADALARARCCSISRVRAIRHSGPCSCIPTDSFRSSPGLPGRARSPRPPSA